MTLSPTLAFAAREARAQRDVLLVGFGLTLIGCIAAALLLPGARPMPPGDVASAVASVAAVCVVSFATYISQRMVTQEFTAGGSAAVGDQFIRRLPGALRQGFVGKMIFFAAAALALTLFALLATQIGFILCGYGIADLQEQLTTFKRPLALTLGTLCLLPWIINLALWMPAGRMAFALLFLLVAAGWSAYEWLVRSYCPGLEKTLPWLMFGIYAVPLGLICGWVAMTRGRRGGGHQRSAWLGAATMGIGLLPVGGWIGKEMIRYHGPVDPVTAEWVHVEGIDPQGRFALVTVSQVEAWRSWRVLVVDLATGQAVDHTKGGLPYLPLEPGVTRTSDTGTTRFWTRRTAEGVESLDLHTGVVAVQSDRHGQPTLSALADTALRERLRGGVPWPTRHGMMVLNDDGSIDNAGPLPPHGYVRRLGEGWLVEDQRMVKGQGAMRCFDFDTRTFLDALPEGVIPQAMVNGWLVAKQRIAHTSSPKRGMLLRDPKTGRLSPLPSPLDRATNVNTFDANRFILANGTQTWVFNPATMDVTLLNNLDAAHLSDCWSTTDGGRVWVNVFRGYPDADPAPVLHTRYAVLNRDTLAIETTVESLGQMLLPPNEEGVAITQGDRFLWRVAPDKPPELIFPKPRN